MTTSLGEFDVLRKRGLFQVVIFFEFCFQSMLDGILYHFPIVFYFLIMEFPLSMVLFYLIDRFHYNDFVGLGKFRDAHRSRAEL